MREMHGRFMRWPIIGVLSFCLLGGLAKATETALPNLRFEYAKGELLHHTEEVISEVFSEVKRIKANPPSGPKSDVLAQIDAVGTDLMNRTGELQVMATLHPDASLRDEAMASINLRVKAYAELYGDPELYPLIEHAMPGTAEEKRLKEVLLTQFASMGANLTGEAAQESKALNQRVTELQGKFLTNLSQDATLLEFAPEELKGASAAFLSGLARTHGGNYLVPANRAGFAEVMTHVEVASSRKRMLSARTNRQTQANQAILSEISKLEFRLAKLNGFASPAERKLEGTMAGDVRTVHEFLTSLEPTLQQRSRSDIGRLLAFKKELDPKADGVSAWDVYYLEDQLKRREYSLDENAIREYFPLQGVMRGIFEVYSKVLEVDFKPCPELPVWHPSVKGYEARNSADGMLLGYFYVDLEARDGKWQNTSAPAIITRGQNPSDSPIAVIQGYFANAENGRPALLSHSQVKDLFHEFGHVLHHLLGRNQYGALASYRVPMDFIETPSQMMENWVYDPKVLRILSGHYLDPTKKLPDETILQLGRARQFNRGFDQAMELVWSEYDQESYQLPIEETGKLYRTLYEKIIGIPPVEDDNTPSSVFIHPMYGYGAVYYGYTWALVNADSIFSKFDGDVSNLAQWRRYRKIILESANTRDPKDLMREFLTGDLAGPPPQIISNSGKVPLRAIQ